MVLKNRPLGENPLRIQERVTLNRHRCGTNQSRGTMHSSAERQLLLDHGAIAQSNLAPTAIQRA